MAKLFKSSRRLMTSLSCSPLGRRRLAFETLEDRRLLAGARIQINAAGQTGSETMQLLIDGTPVAIWNSVGGNTSTGAYASFAYDHDTSVTIDRVRVAFTNDAFNGAGADRNLLVDSVVLDGKRYDTRADNVFSTGTWMAGIGVTPGYKQSPWLHVNGQFRYGQAPSTIDVLAAGRLGEERIALQIDGATVATYDVTGGDYLGGSNYQRFTYHHSAPLSENQVRVAFINDAVTETGDRNVRIDGILLDNVKHESEAPGVLTTGSPGYGGVPQFLQVDKMFINGYFQYGDNRTAVAPQLNQTQIVIRAAGSIGDETMELRIGGVTFATFVNVGGSAGTGVFNEFRYTLTGTVSPSQVSVALTNELGSYTYDRNLRVDWVSIGGVVYQSEAADVYSTGTFVSGVGIRPGYWRTEWLHGNGEFRYATPGNPGTIALGTSLISVDENAGTVSIPVVRTGGSAGTVAVDYTTVPGTATANVDYVTASGTLVFAPGETSKSIVVSILDDATDELNETFNLATDRVLGGAVLGQPRTATITIVDDDGPPPPGSGNGLLGAYYNGQYHQSLVFERTDATIDFDWVLGSPGPGVAADLFSVRWVGQVEARFTETYTFRTSTDDGVNLWVNGVQLVAQYRDQALTSHQGSIALVEGQKYDLMMEYYEKTGYALAKLEWSSPSTPWEVIPASQLYSPPPQITIPGTFAGQTIATGLSGPTALDFDSTGRMFVAEQRGVVRVVQDGQLLAQPFLDIQPQVNFIQDRGMIGLAVHPDFPATPYVYVSYVYDPPETANFTGLAGRDGGGNRVSRVSRFTADAAAGYNRAVPGSEVVLIGANGTWNNISHPELDSTNDINIPATGGPDGSMQDILIIDTLTHAVGNLVFGPEGALYVANGDGASYGRVDPRAVRVQNIDSLSGKILRVDPITGQGLPSNPYYNGDPDANRSKVVNYGLRNPFRFAIQPDSGTLFVGDVGWNTHEEINSGWAKNFGWPYYEGIQGQNAQTGGYNTLATAAAFYANNNAVPPLWSRSHAAGGVAIVVGDFYTGTAYPEQYRGALFFSDFGDNQLRYLRVNEDGSLRSIAPLNLNVGPVVEMSMGPDGFMYYVDISGKIGRLTFTPTTAVAAAALPGSAGDANGDGAVDGGDFLAWQREAAAVEPALAADQLQSWRNEFGVGPASDPALAWLAYSAPVDEDESFVAPPIAQLPSWEPSVETLFDDEIPASDDDLIDDQRWSAEPDATDEAFALYGDDEVGAAVLTAF